MKKNTTHKHLTLSTVTVCDIQKEYYNYFYFFTGKHQAKLKISPPSVLYYIDVTGVSVFGVLMMYRHSV